MVFERPIISWREEEQKKIEWKSTADTIGSKQNKSHKSSQTNTKQPNNKRITRLAAAIECARRRCTMFWIYSITRCEFVFVDTSSHFRMFGRLFFLSLSLAVSTSFSSAFHCCFRATINLEILELYFTHLIGLEPVCYHIGAVWKCPGRVSVWYRPFVCQFFTIINTDK